MGDIPAKEKLEGLLAKPCCLCIGAGVTRKFVGGWKELLGVMLGKRFVSDWLDNEGPYSEVSKYDGAEFFSEFFCEEGFLELGEFLLSDNKAAAPAEYDDKRKAWQEKVFSQQVADIIHDRIGASLGRRCDCSACPVKSECPLRSSGAHSLKDVYASYRLFRERVLGPKDKGGACLAVRDFGTAMSVVDICASGRIRNVINYNFDTVVEEALYEAISARAVESDIDEIHIWTYGTPREPRTVLSSPSCSVILHQGNWDGDIAYLSSKRAVHFFHLHGVAAGSELVDVSGQLIFSQHSYTTFQECMFNWSNVVMEYLLSRFSVIAVGFSGTDPNFRLSVTNHLRSTMEGLSAYESVPREEVLFVKAVEPYRGAIEKRIPDGSPEIVTAFLEYCKGMVSDYYLGYISVSTQWVDGYVDVSDALSGVSGL